MSCKVQTLIGAYYTINKRFSQLSHQCINNNNKSKVYVVGILIFKKIRFTYQIESPATKQGSHELFFPRQSSPYHGEIKTIEVVHLSHKSLCLAARTRSNTRRYFTPNIMSQFPRQNIMYPKATRCSFACGYPNTAKT